MSVRKIRSYRKIDLNQGVAFASLQMRFDSAAGASKSGVLFDAGIKVSWNGSLTQWELTDGSNTAVLGDSFSANDYVNLVWFWDKNRIQPGVAGNHALYIAQATAGGVSGAGTGSYSKPAPPEFIHVGLDAAESNDLDANIGSVAVWDYVDSLAANTPFNEMINGQTSGYVSPLAVFVNSLTCYLPVLDFGGDETSGFVKERVANVDSVGTSNVVISADDQTTSFADNEKVTVRDRWGTRVSGFIEGAPSGNTVELDDGAGGDVDTSEVGRSIGFDGNIYYRAPAGQSTVGNITTGDLAIGFGIRTTGNNQTICEKRDGSDIGYSVKVDSSGDIRCEVETATTLTTYIGGRKVNDGFEHWVGIAYERDGSFNIKIDGDLTQGLQGDTASLGNSTRITIGAKSDGTERFVGVLRDFHFYGQDANTFIPSSGLFINEELKNLESSVLSAYSFGGRAEDHFWKMVDADASSVIADEVSVNLEFVNAGGGASDEKFENVVLSKSLDFETPGLSLPDWQTYNMTGFEVADFIDKSTLTAEKKEGDFTVKMKTESSFGEGYRRNFNVERGKVYYVQFYFDITGATDWDFRIRDVTAATDLSGVTVLTLAGGERFHSQVFEVPNSGALEHEIEIRFTVDSGNAGELFVWNWGVYETAIKGDGNDSSDWTAGGSSSISSITTDAHGEDDHLFWDLTGGAGETLIQALPSINTDDWFVASFWARQVNAGAINIDFRVDGLSDSIGHVGNNSQRGDEFTLSTAYGNFGFVFGTKTDVAGDLKFDALLNDEDVYLDDYVLVAKGSLSLESLDVIQVLTETLGIDDEIVYPREDEFFAGQFLYGVSRYGAGMRYANHAGIQENPIYSRSMGSLGRMLDVSDDAQAPKAIDFVRIFQEGISPQDAVTHSPIPPLDSFFPDQFVFSAKTGGLNYVRSARLTTDGGRYAAEHGDLGYLADPYETLTEAGLKLILSESLGAPETLSQIHSITPIDPFRGDQFNYGVDGPDGRREGIRLLRSEQFPPTAPGYAAEHGRLEFIGDAADTYGDESNSFKRIFADKLQVTLDDSIVLIHDITEVGDLQADQFHFTAGSSLHPTIIAGRAFGKFGYRYDKLRVLLDEALGAEFVGPVIPLSFDVTSLTWKDEVSPKVKITIEDIDVTDKLIIEDGISVEWILDYPTLNVFTAGSVTLNMDNFLGDWELNNSNNFFVQNSFPAHGHKSRVMIQLGFEELPDADDFLVVFAGVTENISTNLQDTKAQFLVVDLSTQIRNGEIRDFGASMPLTSINDPTAFPSANDDYSKFDPVFGFPRSTFPVSTDSVAVTQPSGTSIVPSIRTEGDDLSDDNAEIEYENGKIRFEAEPPSGASAAVLLTWKFSERYKRPDYLIRKLLGHSGIYADLPLGDLVVARATIERALVRNSTEAFSSHGRPNWYDNESVPDQRGIVRYLDWKLLSPSNALPGVSFDWIMLQDGSIVTYGEYEDEYTILDSLPVAGTQLHGFQFQSLDWDDFYILCTNDARGDSSAGHVVRIYKWVRSTTTFSLIAGESDERPQLAYPYDYASGAAVDPVADNRKNFRLIELSGTKFLYYIFADSTLLTAGVKRYNLSTSLHETVYSASYSINDGLEYGIDFELDITDDVIPSQPKLYVFRCFHDPGVDSNFEIIKMNPDGSGPSTIYTETITDPPGSGDFIHATASDIILNTDEMKWYFNLHFHRDTTVSGKAELSRVDRDGQAADTRVVLKTYSNTLHSARSPGKTAKIQAGDLYRYYYLEGNWLATQPTGTDYPSQDEAGHLIEINPTTEALVDHGLVWRSDYSDNPGDADKDGIGVHNHFISNMAVDSRNNLHFISGYGLPVSFNSPRTVFSDPVNREENYVWIQWGKDLSTKIARFDTNDKTVWSLITELARIMNWEMGFGHDHDFLKKMRDILTPTPGLYGSAATLYFRPRSVIEGVLFTNIPDSGSLAAVDIEFDDFRIPTLSRAKFPDPSGVAYIVIGTELFRYEMATNASFGQCLTGIKRAQLGSLAAAHAKGDPVYYIDALALNSGDVRTLESVDDRGIDFANLYNVVNVPYSTHTANSKDQPSIDAHGELALTVANSLLADHDRPWAETKAAEYCGELCAERETIEFTLKFSPKLQVGHLVLFYEKNRITVLHKKLRVLRVQHDTREWKTRVLGREILA